MRLRFSAWYEARAHCLFMLAIIGQVESAWYEARAKSSSEQVEKGCQQFLTILGSLNGMSRQITKDSIREYDHDHLEYLPKDIEPMIAVDACQQIVNYSFGLPEPAAAPRNDASVCDPADGFDGNYYCNLVTQVDEAPTLTAYDPQRLFDNSLLDIKHGASWNSEFVAAINDESFSEFSVDAEGVGWDALKAFLRPINLWASGIWLKNSLETIAKFKVFLKKVLEQVKDLEGKAVIGPTYNKVAVVNAKVHREAMRKKPGESGILARVLCEELINTLGEQLRARFAKNGNSSRKLNPMDYDNFVTIVSHLAVVHRQSSEQLSWWANAIDNDLVADDGEATGLTRAALCHALQNFKREWPDGVCSPSNGATGNLTALVPVLRNQAYRHHKIDIIIGAHAYAYRLPMYRTQFFWSESTSASMSAVQHAASSLNGYAHTIVNFMYPHFVSDEPQHSAKVQSCGRFLQLNFLHVLDMRKSVADPWGVQASWRMAAMVYGYFARTVVDALKALMFLRNAWISMRKDVGDGLMHMEFLEVAPSVLQTFFDNNVLDPRTHPNIKKAIVFFVAARRKVTALLTEKSKPDGGWDDLFPNANVILPGLITIFNSFGIRGGPPGRPPGDPPGHHPGLPRVPPGTPKGAPGGAPQGTPRGTPSGHPRGHHRRQYRALCGGLFCGQSKGSYTR